MKVDSMIEEIINYSPTLKKKYKQDEEYYHDIPYGFYESEVFPFLKEMLVERKINELKAFINFFERKLGQSESFDNLIFITVCESIFYDEYKEEFKKLLSPKLLDGVKYFEEKYDKSQEWFDEINEEISKMKSQN